MSQYGETRRNRHASMYQHGETNPHFNVQLTSHRRGRHYQPSGPLLSQPDHHDQHNQPPGPWAVPIQHSESPGSMVTAPPHQSQDHSPKLTSPQPHHRDHGTGITQPQGSGRQHVQNGGQAPMAEDPQTPGGQPRPKARMPGITTSHPLTWSLGVFCAIFCVVIILGGLAILIVYLIFRPRSPQFDLSGVTLNSGYLDMGYLLNADFSMLVNFTNPNKKVSVDFSYMIMDLYYQNTLIATQYIPPFTLAKAKTSLKGLHMVTSQVGLPLRSTQQLQRQVENNEVKFEVRGLFRARSNLGSLLRYSYWLHSQCIILVSSPPTGILKARRCRTKH